MRGNEKKGCFGGALICPVLWEKQSGSSGNNFPGRYPSRTGLAAVVSGSTTTAVP